MNVISSLARNLKSERMDEEMGWMGGFDGSDLICRNNSAPVGGGGREGWMSKSLEKVKKKKGLFWNFC